MTLTKTFIGAIAFATISATSGFADGIMIHDAYARSAGKMAKAGAAFFMIINETDQDDRLIDVRSSAAKKVELHTHVDQGGGVMKMVHVEEGFAIDAHQTHMLKRGGDHVMFMGLNEAWNTGDILPLTLIFEKAGEINLDVMVDLDRQDTMDHTNN
jgi:copper(I)-binding protein